ncbi:MAG: nodulation protein NodH [Pseudomonadota bacterium]
MGARFDYFIIFAEMRTGSNLLQLALNQVPGISCLGELFNPKFLDNPKRNTAFGIGFAEREVDPLALITALKEKTEGIGGFRFFFDHDPRVADHCIEDHRCAKIILTRNPLEAYVSMKIADAVDQWWLSDAKHRLEVKVDYDEAEFQAYFDERVAFQQDLRRRLQLSGQAAFTATYEDIQEVAVINGMAAYLGVSSDLKRLPAALKKQNPDRLEDKVANFAEMRESLSGFERFDFDSYPNFEPPRGPRVSSFLAADALGLLFMPVVGAQGEWVAEWLEAINGWPLTTGLNRKGLRQWKREHKGHRSFSVVTHPLLRAWRAFSSRIRDPRAEEYQKVRDTLTKHYGMVLPQSEDDVDGTRAAFHCFLSFLKLNLARQTSLPIDPAWASQLNVLSGYARVVLPDLVVRETHLVSEIGGVVASRGAPATREPEVEDISELERIYDDSVEDAARRAYPRDYLSFGFDSWKARTD